MTLNFRDHLLKFSKEELIDLIYEYENTITWGVTCVNCAKLLDDNYKQYAALSKVKELIQDAERDQGNTVLTWRLVRAIGDCICE